MMERAQQMVEGLSEENRTLKQEMEVCRDKVAKLQKVTGGLERCVCVCVLGSGGVTREREGVLEYMNVGCCCCTYLGY